MKFKNRCEAAKILSDGLVSLLKTEMCGNQVIVLGIPRGGVIFADIVSTALRCDFDIVIARKLGAPDNKELAIGAIMHDGTSYVNRYLINALSIGESYIEQEKSRQLQEIQRRSSTYRKSGLQYDLFDKIVILTDDGIATGATIIAASRWIRKLLPKKLIIAVPVVPSATVDILKQEADIVEAIITPPDFNSVGEFYQDFKAVEDAEVISIMKSRNLL